jgi:hypothetical protein
MADKQVIFNVLNNSSEYFEESTSNLLQLFRGTTSYVGNSDTDPNFTYLGKGLWAIGVNASDSGVYTVKKSTDAGSTYTEVTGLSTVPILMKDMLMLAGGTMEGNIAMASNEITGVSNLTFNDASGTIQGIAAKNLLDKTATEAITGNWTHSGAMTITGTLNVSTPSNFQLGGVSLSGSLSANDLNLMRGLYSASYEGQKIMTTGIAYGAVPKTADANVTLTLAHAGVITCDMSNGNLQVTLPEMKTRSAGAIFIIIRSGASNTLTVVPTANAGFIMKTGKDTQITGSVITMDATEISPDSVKFVILMCTGTEGANARWAIIGGSDAALS